MPKRYRRQQTYNSSIHSTRRRPETETAETSGGSVTPSIDLDSDHSSDGGDDEAQSDDDEYKPCNDPDVECTIDGVSMVFASPPRKSSKYDRRSSATPNFQAGEYDRVLWRVLPRTDNNYLLINNDTKQQYTIPRSRINKAMKILDPAHVSQSLQPRRENCNCAKQCATSLGVSAADVIAIRTAFLQMDKEHSATDWISSVIRTTNPSIGVILKDTFEEESSSTSSGRSTSYDPNRQDRQDSKPTPVSYRLFQKDMCQHFFTAVLGCSRQKVTHATQAVLQGPATKVLPYTRASQDRKVYNVCRGFWRKLFEQVCQKPNDHIRLFPVKHSFRMIYNDYFKNWHKRVLGDQHDLPSFSTFFAARYDKEFEDVKRRERHNHARCLKCHEIQTMRLRAFRGEISEEEYKIALRNHDEERKGWRAYEEAVTIGSQHSPSKINCLSYDDTSDVCFPVLTNRPIKNFTQSKFHMIPWLIKDHGGNKQHYIYTPKNKYSKGANRLCTSLYFQLRAIKTSNGPQAKARELVLIADNFAENQNNTNLAFGTELVLRGWYDVVMFLFGPVGHTHNGIDAQHHIHNEVVGAFTSCSWPKFLIHFEDSFTQPDNRPVPALLNVNYDWDERYRTVMRKLAGFTKTTGDKYSVRGWKIAKCPRRNVVEVRFKRDPAKPGPWLGQEGKADTPGFIILKCLPGAMPHVIPPRKQVMKQVYYQQLTSEAVRNVCRMDKQPEAFEWLREVAVNGVIPLAARLEDTIADGELGIRCKVSCDGFESNVISVEAVTNDPEAFWRIPHASSVDDPYISEYSKKCAEDHTKLPNVRYQNTSSSWRSGSNSQQRTSKSAQAEDDTNGSDIEDSTHPAHWTNCKVYTHCTHTCVSYVYILTHVYAYGLIYTHTFIVRVTLIILIILIYLLYLLYLLYLFYTGEPVCCLPISFR